MEGICVNFLDPVQFFRLLKGHCHGNQFCGKITNPPALIALAYRQGMEYRFSVCALTVQRMPLYPVKIS